MKESRTQLNVTGRCISFVLILALIMAFTMNIGTYDAYALSVPKVTIDAASLKADSTDNIVITGTVSRSKGQAIHLLAADGETVIAQTTAGNGDGSSTFKLSVPAKYANDHMSGTGTFSVYVQSQAVKGLAASKKAEVNVAVKIQKSQTISAPSSITLTNLKTSDVIKAKASSGLKLTYKSSNSQVVSVKSNGEIKRKKNGKATITITQAGNSNYSPVTKNVQVTCRKSTKQEQIDGAVAWAIKIANDNSFTYGTGSGAHHNGCYFCGTNYGPRKYMKPSKKYKKTYCCNPFVHAAYAHGAQHPKMLKYCRKASAIDMTKSSYYRFGCWKCVGKPAYKNLQKGDVLVKSTHVAMYIGKGKMVEASGGNWSASSIAVKKMSKSRYNGFTYVMRYTGY